MMGAALPPTTVNAHAAELLLLVAGLIFTAVIVAVFGTVIWRALRAERRAEAERLESRRRFDELGRGGVDDAIGGDGE